MEISEAQKIVKKDAFEDGVSGLLFVVLRLSNQLGIDVEKAFEKVSRRIVKKLSLDYKGNLRFPLM